MIGTVYLRVAGQDSMVAFYRDTMGLTVQRKTDDTIYMGAGGVDLLAIIARPDF